MNQIIHIEHHHGLNFCLNLKSGIKNGIDRERLANYAGWFYEHHLMPHMQLEEKEFFPILGINHPQIVQALSEHHRLRELFECKESHEKSICLIINELDYHIRFEERTVFPSIKKLASAQQLKILKNIHEDIDDSSSWHDPFWI